MKLCDRTPIAVIDVGSNTLRLLVGYVNDGKLTEVAAMRAVTQLGRGIVASSRLNPEAIELSIRSLINFKQTAQQYGVTNYFAFGTSALRDATDSAVFLDRVKRNTGIDIDIISGQREAELTLKGALCGVQLKPGRTALIDIGGGSTELITFRNGSDNYYERLNLSDVELFSLPLGAVNLSDQFIHTDPPDAYDLSETRRHISKVLSDIQHVASAMPVSSVIATGGTPTTIAAIDLKLQTYSGDAVHSHIISTGSLLSIYNLLIVRPAMERSRIIGMEQDRSDIIIAGTLILLETMVRLQAQHAVISDFGILEGKLLECFH